MEGSGCIPRSLNIKDTIQESTAKCKHLDLVLGFWVKMETSYVI